MTTSLIVAAAENDVIGAGGALPWHLPEDLRRFRRLTTGHAVVLGRVTHESIVARLGRALPGRTSVVVSSRGAAGAGGGGAADDPPEVAWAGSVAEAIAAARAAEARGGTPGLGSEVFVLGGASVYEQALPEVDRVYLTRVHREVAGDTSMPAGWLDGFTLAGRDERPGADGGFSFLEYQRRPA
ncbi:MAG TPA: dihydrofolate reductase [Streptosporangiaceae bacterium]